MCVAVSLEPAFTASESAAAAFRFRGAPAEVHGRRAILHESPSRWPRRAVARLTNPHIPSVKLGPVQFLDRLGNRRRVAELDESEPTRFVGGSVDREKHFRDLTHLSEQGLEVCLRGLVAQVTDEDS